MQLINFKNIISLTNSQYKTNSKSECCLICGEPDAIYGGMCLTCYCIYIM